MSAPVRTPPRLSPLVELLRCLECGSSLKVTELRRGDDDQPAGALQCTSCQRTYAVTRGTVRMLRSKPEPVKRQTAESFAYEWEEFGGLRPEWEKNFTDYMRPHAPDALAGKLILDVGAGSGRHSFHAARYGAQVVAVDLGTSIDVARANLPPDVLTVQADAEDLPFDPASFDIVMSIGVLHHLPDPERALRSIAPYARHGGHVHIYLYWVPERASHRAVLRVVTLARRVTVSMPHRLLHALCYPLAIGLWLGAVCPYRMLRARPRARRLADMLPLKTYADYPFGVLVNDQFDRFSAPLEVRYTRAEVQGLLERAGCFEVLVLANHGWVADGRVGAGTVAGG